MTNQLTEMPNAQREVIQEQSSKFNQPRVINMIKNRHCDKSTIEVHCEFKHIKKYAKIKRNKRLICAI